MEKIITNPKCERDIMKNTIKAGDVISVSRTRFHINNIYKHFGVYIGNNRVVHFTALGGKCETDAKLAYIQETDLEVFLAGGEYHIESYTATCFNRDDIVYRAKSRVGKGLGLYGLVLNNCEHFAVWCATGKYHSLQVERVARFLLGRIGSLIIDTLAEKTADKRWASAA